MKIVFLALVTLLLTALSTDSVNAQNSEDIAKGAGLWANNCTRCHNARSPMERNDREWVTIMNHMRARANLTKSEARAITAYLQAVNTPESVSSVDGKEALPRIAAVPVEFLRSHRNQRRSDG